MDSLKLINMGDVVTEQIKYLWHPYIAYGKITIVQGDPGDGKTSMMLAIAASLTNGENIEEGGGDAALSPSNVIFQTAEDGLADTIKPRLERLGADCTRVDVIDEDDKPLSLIDERIEAAIVRTGAKLFILDPLQAYMGGADMNGTGGVRPLMKRLAAVAESTGAAIVLIGHLNKSGGSKSVYRGLGSIDIPAAARSVLTVGRLVDMDENMRAFIQTKSNLAPAGKPQAFALDPVSGFLWLGDCDITIEELLDGKKEQKSASQLDLAKAFIKGLLAHGDVAASVVFAKGGEAGFPEATMKRAKSDIGVKSVKRGNEWFWVMEPDQGYQAAQESQQVREPVGGADAPDTLDTLDTLPHYCRREPSGAVRGGEDEQRNGADIARKGNEAERSL